MNYVEAAQFPLHDLAVGAEDVEVLLDCPSDCRGAFICWSTGGRVIFKSFSSHFQVIFVINLLLIFFNVKKR